MAWMARSVFTAFAAAVAGDKPVPAHALFTSGAQAQHT